VAEAEAGVPVLGLIDSVAAELRSGRIGILATPATAASGAYRRAIEATSPASTVLEVGCPAFVPLIQTGDLETPALRQAAEGYLQPLLEAGVDTIVLGCTHYPLLTPLLRSLLPPEVELVDPALAAARRLGPLIAGLEAPADPEAAGEGDGEPVTYCVTGSAEAFAASARAWLGLSPTVHGVSLQSPARIG